MKKNKFVILLVFLLTFEFVLIISNEVLFLPYIIKKHDYSIAEAIITDVSWERVSGGKYDRYQKMTSITYQYAKKEYKIKLASDIKDIESNKIKIAISNNGEIFRTSFFVSADIFTYIPLICNTLLIILCIWRIFHLNDITFTIENKSSINNSTTNSLYRYLELSNRIIFIITILVMFVGLIILLFIDKIKPL